MNGGSVEALRDIVEAGVMGLQRRPDSYSYSKTVSALRGLTFAWERVAAYQL